MIPVKLHVLPKDTKKPLRETLPVIFMNVLFVKTIV